MAVVLLALTASLEGCSTTSVADPVPLHSTDPRYGEYLDRVRQMIKAKWGYPCVRNDVMAPCEYKSAKLTIQFGLREDGQVDYITVIKKSEWEIYDKYAVNAIRLAAPFPPVPSALMALARPGSASVRILAAFDYKLGRLSQRRSSMS